MLTLRGEHDLSTRYRLVEALSGSRGAPHLIVDLTPCTFVDSVIIGVLLRACRALPEGRRVEIVLPHADDCVNRAFTLAGMRALLSVQPSLGHALQNAAMCEREERSALATATRGDRQQRWPGGGD